MEIEGVTPVLETSNNFFIFSVQDKLYTIDSKKLEFKFVSSKCDGYAQNNGKIIYYKFITDERTEGYSIDLFTRENRSIDNSLNEKIFNCEKSFLFTANIDNNFIPTYTICNKPYLWVNNKWKIVSEVLVYKDNKLTVKIPFEGSVIKDNYFQWELRQQFMSSKLKYTPNFSPICFLGRDGIWGSILCLGRLTLPRFHSRISLQRKRIDDKRSKQRNNQNQIDSIKFTKPDGYKKSGRWSS